MERDDDLIGGAPSTTEEGATPKEATPNENRLFLLNEDYRRQSPDYAIDVVAVHGLGGDAYKTWTHANKTLWLKDFLPKDLPGARVFTFNYNSAFCFSRETGGLRTYARVLLECIRCERTRPEVAKNLYRVQRDTKIAIGESSAPNLRLP